MTENNNKSLTIQEYFKSDKVVANFANVLGSQTNAQIFIMNVLVVVANNERLQKCTKSSIYTSAMRSATLRLSVDPATKQGHLVPYGDQCTFIPGWKGYYDLAMRTGRYTALNVAPIYEGEAPEIDRLTSKFIRIKGKQKSDQIIGYVGYFELDNGFQKSLYMTVEELEAHKEKYVSEKSYNHYDSAWKTNTHDMYKKTVYRQLLSKHGVFDPADQQILSQIDEPYSDTDYDVPGEDGDEIEAQFAEMSPGGQNGEDEPVEREVTLAQLKALCKPRGVDEDQMNQLVDSFLGDIEKTYAYVEEKYPESKAQEQQA